MQILEILDGRIGGTKEIPSLILIPVDNQTVFSSRRLHELPETHGALLGPRMGPEPTFGHGNILEIVRKAVLLQHLFYIGKIPF